MEKIQVTEENFHAAVNNAGYWARRRLVKKLTKRIYRAPEYVATTKLETSPLTGETLMVLDRTKPYGRFPEPRPPTDLEQYVTNFVLTYRGDENV